MPEVIDELKAIERCARSRGTPACDAIANRLAAVLSKLAERWRIAAESSREQFPDDHARYRYYADRAEQLAREVKP